MTLHREDLARRVETACLNGWPALKLVVLDTAILRLSDGYTRRANSVNLLGPLAGASGDVIRACENVYARHGLPTIFRLSSAVPSDLDVTLDAAGYAPPEDAALVLHGTVPPHIAADAAVRLTPERPDETWLDALARIQTLNLANRDTHRRILDALAVPAVFAAAIEGGDTVALAFGAVHEGVVCINSVATDARFRRRGLARRAIAAVMAWASREAGATTACVPVVADNAPAVALYRSLGLADEALRYHYRRRPAGEN